MLTITWALGKITAISRASAPGRFGSPAKPGLGVHFSSAPSARGARSRAGFSNTTLLAAVGFFAIVSLLMLVQTGQVNFSRAVNKAAKEAAAAAPQKGKAAKPPPLIPPVLDPLRPVAERYTARLAADQARQEDRLEETTAAVGLMDVDSAAQLLTALGPPAAAGVLANLEERAIARILDCAAPEVAARWIEELLRQPQPALVPEEFKKLAAKAGLYDDTLDQLTQYRAGQSAAETAAAVTDAAGQPPVIGGSAAEPAGAVPTEETPADQGTDAQPGASAVAPPPASDQSTTTTDASQAAAPNGQGTAAAAPPAGATPATGAAGAAGQAGTPPASQVPGGP